MQCQYVNGVLAVDGVPLEDVAARFGTPCFVYSRAAIEARFRAYDAAFGTRAHRVCYAVKANDNLSIVRVLERLGAGFDIVSGGELERVLATGAAASDVVFSGVGKTAAEIARAVAAGVGCLNVESAAELARIADAAAAANRPAPIAIRVNPDIDAGTHPYISTGLKENKFGVPLDEARRLYREAHASRWLEPRGVACHIGSQLTSIAPVVDAVREVVALAEELDAAGIALEHIDVGGGLGIRYQDEQPPAIGTLVEALLAVVPARYTVVMEPGRSIVGESGVLLTRVEYLKAAAARNFVIVDAAMNDLLRPALYDAWHEVRPCREPAADAVTLDCDVVGPVCESGDFLARGRRLAVVPGDLLAVMSAGAYGFAMASNYNARPRPPEVLIEAEGARLVRAREQVGELMRDELARLRDD
ncbi:MAG: diaminopimelate decarboxylase [Gammaproteobacteria bacterium]|uniref:diaminopimelate decarboxylase n=1 Tax=Algiphilus sp. TaxID=1872431 RepID=UPI0032EAAEF5